MPLPSPDQENYSGALSSNNECSLVVTQQGQVVFCDAAAQTMFNIQTGDRLHVPGMNGNEHSFTQESIQISRPGAPLSSISTALRVAPILWHDTPAYLVHLHIPGKGYEEALRHSEERYINMVEQQTELVIRFRPDTAITYVNPATCRFFEKTRQDLVGSSLLSLFPTPIHRAVEWRLRTLSESPHMAMDDLQFQTPAGEPRWVRATIQPLTAPGGSVIEFQAVGRDITAQKNAEDALRQSEMRFYELLKNAHLMAVIVNLDGSVRFANDFLLNITGYTAEKMLSINWFDTLLPPEEVERVRNSFQRMAQSGEVIPYVKNYIRTRDGRRLLVAWNCTLVRDSSGTVIGVAVLGEDITERSWGEKVQEITYRISQSVTTSSNLEELYVFIHRSLGELMPVDNFFICLHNPETDEYSFPYFVDQYDPPPPPARSEKGLTAYVLRTGQAVLASPELFERLYSSGEVESVGAPCVDWLGVPLKIGNRTIGVMVVQTYTEGVRFGQREVQIFDFVSTQVAMAIERKRVEQALRENEEKYRALVEASSDAIFLETMDGQILDCNSAACEMFGYTKDELMCLTVRDLLPEDNRANMSEIVRLELENGGGRWEMHNCRKDGTVFPVDVNTRLMEIGGQRLSVVYVSDTTERKRREREMDAMAGVSAALRTAITQVDILPVILQQLVDRLRVHGAFITLVDTQTNTRRIELGCGTWAALSNITMAPGCPLCNQVINNGRMYLNNDARNDPTFPFPEIIDGVKAIASAPLITQGQVLGALTVGYEQPIHTEDLNILTAISDIAASAIHRARLYEQTSFQASELVEAYDATIEGWALALELRDKETRGHSHRVTGQTLRLAAHMGLPESEMVHIRRGVLLHDIGKMGIPDSILLKPGPLTDEEWIIMRKHPDYAHKMLSSIRYLGPALDIPLCHHERWDGSGYPNRLSGEAIPMYARIFAVVDVMDALTSARPYRPAWTHEEALEHIRSQSGLHFDPKVVTAFLALLD